MVTPPILLQLFVAIYTYRSCPYFGGFGNIYGRYKDDKIIKSSGSLHGLTDFIFSIEKDLSLISDEKKDISETNIEEDELGQLEEQRNDVYQGIYSEEDPDCLSGMKIYYLKYLNKSYQYHNSMLQELLHQLNRTRRQSG